MPSTRLDDGFSTTIVIENIPSVKLYERDVTPPGISAGGAIETTTMRNTTWRTMAPRSLKTLSPVTATVAYAVEAYDDIIAQVGLNQLIRVLFPDTTEIEFYGWIEEFTPGANTEGEQPTANIVIQPSNRNSSGVETAPDYITDEST